MTNGSRQKRIKHEIKKGGIAFYSPSTQEMLKSRSRRLYKRHEKQLNPGSTGKTLLMFGLLGFGVYYIGIKLGWWDWTLTHFGTQSLLPIQPTTPDIPVGTVPGSSTVTTTPNSGTNLNTVVNTPIVNLNTATPQFAPWAIAGGKIVDKLNALGGNTTHNVDEWNYWLTQIIPTAVVTDLGVPRDSNDSFYASQYMDFRTSQGLNNAWIQNGVPGLSGLGATRFGDIQWGEGIGNIYNVGPYAEKVPGRNMFTLHRGLGELLYKYGGRPTGFTTMGAGRSTGIERKGISRFIQ